MSETNKALVRAYYTQVWNAHRPEATERFFATTFADHNPAIPDQPAGAAGAQAIFSTFLAAFPDLQFTLDVQIAEGDLVSTRWISTGTHRGELMGMPPTGKRITITGIDILRVQGDKIVERWGNFDMAGMLQQLGIGQG